MTRRLRHLRAESGLTQTDVANRLDWSQSKVNRIELGEVAITRTDLSALLEIYGVAEPETIAELLAIAKTARQQNFTQHRDIFAKEFLHFLEFEGLANHIKHYESNVVPGPLQTEEYARATLRAVRMVDYLPARDRPEVDDLIERKIRVRMERKRLLLQESDAVKAEFILNEGILRLAVGAESGQPELMTRQLQHLAELAEVPNVDVRVLPSSAGAHPGLQGGFVVLELPEPYGDSLLYMENSAGELSTRDQPDKVDLFVKVFDQLRARAVALADLEPQLGNRTVD
ncbi:transcriptional regulator [Plantactinospora endophytica]|uniref:Transcriptional regulator n=1 Tax=Plantactinospora endophytica TaxID=673535 RepID=A0ABQ4E6C4_9ACTN|nr:transcriptional regulator [Plantactinospora endophytica]